MWLGISRCCLLLICPILLFCLLLVVLIPPVPDLLFLILSQLNSNLFGFQFMFQDNFVIAATNLKGRVLDLGRPVIHPLLRVFIRVPSIFGSGQQGEPVGGYLRVAIASSKPLHKPLLPPLLPTEQGHPVGICGDCSRHESCGSAASQLLKHLDWVLLLLLFLLLGNGRTLLDRRCVSHSVAQRTNGPQKIQTAWLSQVRPRVGRGEK